MPWLVQVREKIVDGSIIVVLHWLVYWCIDDVFIDGVLMYWHTNIDWLTDALLIDVHTYERERDCLTLSLSCCETWAICVLSWFNVVSCDSMVALRVAITDCRSEILFLARATKRDIFCAFASCMLPAPPATPAPPAPPLLTVSCCCAPLIY